MAIAAGVAGCADKAPTSSGPSPLKQEIIVYSAYRGGRERLYVMPAAGGRSTQLPTRGIDVAWFPSLSPDARHVVFTGDVQLRKDLTGAVDDYATFLYVIDTDGSDLRRLDTAEGEGFDPAWSPDGKSILFSASAAGLCVVPVSGGTPHRLSDDPRPMSEATWSPDGRKVVCRVLVNDRWQLFTLDADGGNLRQLTSGRGDAEYPAWSPDGKWIAFSSSRDAFFGDLYLVPAAGGSIRRLTRNGDTADTYPRWSGDGSQLLYWTSWGGWDEAWRLALLDVAAALSSGDGVPRDSKAIRIVASDLGPTGENVSDTPLGSTIGPAQ